MPKPTNSRPSRLRVRSSVKYCQEHSSCSQDEPNIAKYKCRDCNSFQCEDCSRELHATYVNHEVARLEEVNPQLICSTKTCHNFADFYCQFCQILSGGVQLCVVCDRKVHTSLNYNHQRITFDQHQRELELRRKEEEERIRQQLNEAKLYSEYNSNNSALKRSNANSSSLSDQDADFFSIRPSSLESPCLPCDSTTRNHLNSNRTKGISKPNSSYSESFAKHSSSPEASLEEEFFTIKAEALSESLEMRSGHHSSSRGRRLDRQGSTDSSVMMTMKVESGQISPDIQHRSVRLIDDEENLLIHTPEEFLKALGMEGNEDVKVVSIFGNTGVGKSYTMNAVFFRGEEVFKTSASQESCTYGVWVAHDPRLECLVIDTEGLLGKTTNEARRRRLLLKVLGISDVVIYRTNASRLENDMFHFLHDASKAYEDYFAAELKAIMSSSDLELPVTSMSPLVVIFQETKHTIPLSNDSDVAIRELHKRAKEMKISLSALPGLCYVGMQTSRAEETNFKPLEMVLKQSLTNNGKSARIPRPARVVYQVLKQLNKKYSGEIPDEDVIAFSSKYFSCRFHCKACGQRCQLSLNHEESQHHREESCKYRADIGNRVFMCRRCFDGGEEQLVRWQTCTTQESGIMGMMMFLKRGHIIECPKHGVIYKSFEHWYNNPPPEAAATVIRLVHVWPGDIPLSADGTPGHVGQRIIDMGKTVTQAVSPSLQVASEWMSDQVAPEYWTPNSTAQCCKICHVELGGNLSKHHCRRCGRCVCEHCSAKQMVLPSWGARPVRVCDPCSERPLSIAEGCDGNEGKIQTQDVISRSQRRDSSTDVTPTDGTLSVDAANGEQQVTARVVTETVGQAAGVFSAVFKHSANWVKDLARPSYWKPDSELIKCADCGVTFGPTEEKELQKKYGLEVKRHHCRRCGDGFCSFCSSKKLPVPSRGWESPVRVCDRCSEAPSPL